MKKIAIFVSIVVLLTTLVEKASAQYYFYDDKFYDSPLLFELGGSVGIMNCLTDLGGRKGIGKKFIKDLNMGKTKLAGSIYLSANYKNALALKLEATFGEVTADDKVLEKVKTTTFGRYERNLSFKSKITDFMLGVEIHPLFIINKYDEDKEPPRYSPYLLVGVGFFSFNPQAKLGNKWVDLQPLRTEGQGFDKYPNRTPYKLNQVNIPLGLGIKYELSSNLNLRGEFVYRVLSTDYLDDVSTEYVDPSIYDIYPSAKRENALALYARQKDLNPFYIVNEGDQRGNPKNNDGYFTFSIKIGYIFGRERIKNR